MLTLHIVEQNRLVAREHSLQGVLILTPVRHDLKLRGLQVIDLLRISLHFFLLITTPPTSLPSFFCSLESFFLRCPWSILLFHCFKIVSSQIRFVHSFYTIVLPQFSLASFTVYSSTFNFGLYAICLFGVFYPDLFVPVFLKSLIPMASLFC